jgi:hypothetical protein
VKDFRTDLIWLMDANCYGTQIWYKAMGSAEGLNSGECGLSDGSAEGDWHLATLDELMEIGTDPTASRCYPPDYGATWTMPGVPFSNVMPGSYWSSTFHEAFGTDATYRIYGFR